MIKKPESKNQLRAEIERQTREYLQDGQSVKEIPKGVGSRDAAAGPFKAPFKRENWQGNKQASERTYLTDVVDSLESRKKNRGAVANSSKRPKKPRKRLIYDDFGEPLRWVWVDE
ncbi:MAG: hypothetical protein WBN40_11505 [Pseudomonadales bacterium]